MPSNDGTQHQGGSQVFGKLTPTVYETGSRQIAETIRELAGNLKSGIERIERGINQYIKAVNAASASENQNEQVRQKLAENVFALNQQTEGNKTAREKRSNTIQNSIRWATWIAALGAIFYGAIAAYQAHQMTLATDAATRSAKAAECASKTAAAALEENKKQFSLTSTQNQKQFSETLGQIKAQTTQQKIAANAAASAAKTAEDTLIANDRPWLTAAVGLASPFTFTKDGSASLQLRYSLRNAGHSPGLNVGSYAEMFLVQNPEKDPNVERERVCDKATQRASQLGEAVFPSGISPDIHGTFDTGVGEKVIQSKRVGRDFITPNVILCLAYQTTLDDKWHHTGMIFDVHRIEKEHPAASFAIKIGEDVPQDQLGFTLSLFHGIIAD